MRQDMEFNRCPAVSFILRCWQERTPQGWTWRGEVVHVQSGQKHQFQGMERLSNLLQDLMGSVTKNNR